MPSIHDPVDVVIRFPGVTLSRESFETLLGLPVDRFAARAGIANHAQISLPEGSSWDDLVALIDRIGPALQACLERGEMTRPCVDAALYLVDRTAAASLAIPSKAALAAGRWGLDLVVSAYLTSLG